MHHYGPFFQQVVTLARQQAIRYTVKSVRDFHAGGYDYTDLRRMKIKDVRYNIDHLLPVAALLRAVGDTIDNESLGIHNHVSYTQPRAQK